MVPVRLIQPYLSEREDFQLSGLVITTERDTADAVVHLAASGKRDTRILVSNRITGDFKNGTSTWTDYPGMIALDVMEKLNAVCPGSIAPPPEHFSATNDCASPDPEMQLVRTISACSRTSWMDSSDIYRALQLDGELETLSIQELPPCNEADAILEVRHNLELTVEWNWTLRLRKGRTVASGRVVAEHRR